MHVVATAGHVDHGKSTLVKALTGTDPDRLAEERRRGLTIDLGFAWTTLPDAGEVAFVDVPGHERFVTTMLAGVGSVPATMFVVAADEGWMAQSSEHLEALDALGVRHGLLVVTRSDLADPALAIEEAREWMVGSTLADVPAVSVCAVTGAGVDDVRHALGTLVSGLPAPDPAAPVRLWVDRSFSVRGAGTIVTGTLAEGSVAPGDELVDLAGRALRVRGVEALGAPRDRVAATARVALNLRGVESADVPRGAPLLTPAAWWTTDLADVRTSATQLPERLMLHVGTAAVPCHVRDLGDGHARLRLDRALPLRFGDRALLRDPGRHHVAAGVTVLDVDPPPLTRRGAARARATELTTVHDAVDATSALLRRGPRRGPDLTTMGLPTVGAPRAGDWWVDPDRWSAYATDLERLVHDWHDTHPLEPGLAPAVAASRLGLPDPTLVSALADETHLARTNGLLTIPSRDNQLPAPVEAALVTVEQELTNAPFQSPDVPRLAELGLGTAELAAAERVGRVIRVAPGVPLLPDAVTRAHDLLSGLPQPFTLSEARQAMQTTRRVAVPLLELLASRGLTRRTDDGRHEVIGRNTQASP
ncbi:MAG: selenocysteine-specific translation elongation factor [Streptosporangiales bacterium]|nr:selenocysteine-specific translation elongation factor [Streptosporangiales bacterium]